MRFPSNPSTQFYRHYRRSVRGVVAVEFAIMAPIAILLMIGSFDVTNALIASNRLANAAQEVVEIATATAGQMTNGSHTQFKLTDQEAYAATTAPFAVLTDLASRVPPSNVSQPPTTNVKTSFSITLSDVTFPVSPANCTSGCTYPTAKTSWTMSNHLGTTKLRPCSTLTQVANNTSPATDLSTMPAGAYGSVDVLVADLSYNFVPLFTGYVIGPITLNRTAYLSARTGSTIGFTTGTTDTATVCS